MVASIKVSWKRDKAGSLSFLSVTTYRGLAVQPRKSCQVHKLMRAANFGFGERKSLYPTPRWRGRQ